MASVSVHPRPPDTGMVAASHPLPGAQHVRVLAVALGLLLDNTDCCQPEFTDEVLSSAPATLAPLGPEAYLFPRLLEPLLAGSDRAPSRRSAVHLAQRQLEAAAPGFMDETLSSVQVIILQNPSPFTPSSLAGIRARSVCLNALHCALPAGPTHCSTHCPESPYRS
jgi:hypothetical protein